MRISRSRRAPPAAADALAVAIRADGRTVPQIAAALGLPTRSLYRWAEGSARPCLYAAHLLEAWAALPAEIWLDEVELEQIRAVRAR
jgi:DNA-binding transcriptional regulator YiaG